MMTRGQLQKLDTILAKIEALQNQSSDRNVRDRLGLTRDALLSLYNEENPARPSNAKTGE